MQPCLAHRAAQGCRPPQAWRGASPVHRARAAGLRSPVAPGPLPSAGARPGLCQEQRPAAAERRPRPVSPAGSAGLSSASSCMWPGETKRAPQSPAAVLGGAGWAGGRVAAKLLSRRRVDSGPQRSAARGLPHSRPHGGPGPALRTLRAEPWAWEGPRTACPAPPDRTGAQRSAAGGPQCSDCRAPSPPYPRLEV